MKKNKKSLDNLNDNSGSIIERHYASFIKGGSIELGEDSNNNPIDDENRPEQSYLKEDNSDKFGPNRPIGGWYK